jgi:hypothetical protein
MSRACLVLVQGSTLDTAAGGTVVTYASTTALMHKVDGKHSYIDSAQVPSLVSLTVRPRGNGGLSEAPLRRTGRSLSMLWQRCLVLSFVFGNLIGFPEASHGATPEFPECPTLPGANSRLQARADFLLSEVENAQGLAARVAPAAGVDLIVALASVITGRAKEEARLWLLDQLSRHICSSDAKKYFANTCEAVVKAGEYPGASLNLLRTQLRRDIYALPACYGYLHIGTVPNGPAPLSAAGSTDDVIDAYVLEAALVGVYLRLHEGSTISDDVPKLETLPTEEELGRLVVGAAFARLKWWQAGPPLTLAPSRFAHDERRAVGSVTCPKPTPAQIAAFADAVITQLKTTIPKATPEAILKTVIEQLKPVCAPLADDLNALAIVYVTATHGDYVETALGAASSFLCNADSDTPPKLCARLPLLGEVAASKTQEEVEAALDRLISPLGAWKRKQSEWVVSLNAMAGIAGGWEELQDVSESGDHSTYGLYMPIGIESSWAVPWKRIGAVAVGAQAVDLGAIVSYSEKTTVEGGESSTEANTEWSSITSPGVYVAVAFRNTPFRLGVSYSKTPKLRSVNFSDGTERDVDSTRLLIFVTVDVTLLPF